MISRSISYLITLVLQRACGKVFSTTPPGKHSGRWPIGPSVLLLACLAIACPASIVADEPETANTLSFKQREHQAIVVGVNAYSHRFVEQLEFAVNDARRVEDALSTLGYDVTVLTNDMATPQRILDAVNTAGNRLSQAPPSRRGNLVFVFSGHGFSKGSENYLGTVNTNPFQLAETSLSISTLKESLNKAQLKRSFLFIDACRRDPGKDAQGPSRRFVFDEQSEGVAILYSTAPETLSYEDIEFEAGLFSYYLAQAFSGAAADATGLLSFETVEQYVVNKVVERSTSRYGRTQRPYIAGERSGRFTIGQISVPAAKTLKTASTSNSESSSSRRWWTMLGMVAVGALVANALSEESEDDTAPVINFIIPTP